MWEGENNSYWLGLADGSVWMRYGSPDEPVDHMKRINASVETLQSVLAVYEAYVRGESDDLGVPEREELIGQTVIHAVAADPEVFEDDENWWPQTFLEVEFHLGEGPPRRPVALPTRQPRCRRQLGSAAAAAPLTVAGVVVVVVAVALATSATSATPVTPSRGRCG